ncbi:MAG: hypothetical protein HY391_00710 [Deltaproteobacteria bacterium]|nr:hypothetical protein [Deltaproteobacteria bacterium]
MCGKSFPLAQIALNFCLSFLSSFLCYAEDLSPIQNGDLLFQSFPSYLCSAIQRETDSPYCHIGIAVWKGDELFVIEAFGKAVVRTPWNEWRERANGRESTTSLGLAIGHWKNYSPQERWQIASAAKSYLGVPYDPDFRWGKESLYCSELIYFALKEGLGKEVLTPLPMHFDRFPDFWRKYFNGSPPSGELGITPGAWSSVDLLELIAISR